MQTIIDPQSHRLGQVIRQDKLRACCRDLRTGGYFYVRLTEWGEPYGGKPNPELLAIVARITR